MDSKKYTAQHEDGAQKESESERTEKKKLKC